MLILIISVMVFDWLLHKLVDYLSKYISNGKTISMIQNSIGFSSLAIIIVVCAGPLGIDKGPLILILLLIALIFLGVLKIFSSFMPDQTYVKGNTIRVGKFLGVVESYSFLGTRLRTFDGKTLFLPIAMLFKDVIVNYHFDTVRKISINVLIKYDQDIIEAKRALETVMIEDARVNEKPSPVVYTLELGQKWIELGARCWVDNKKFWMTKCDLAEKIKYKFDLHGISFAHPQLGITHNNPWETTDTYNADSENI